MTPIEKFTELMEDVLNGLEELKQGQEEIKENQAEIMEKIDNLSRAGGDYSIQEIPKDWSER